MKTFFLILLLSASTTTYGNLMSNLSEFASKVPTQEIDKVVAKFLENELAYTSDFKSEYTLAEFKMNSTGDTWYIVDGYYQLADKTVLFLDFNYNPELKTWKPINNYNFIPAENKRYLLKAEEICNPFDRSFIGVIAFSFHQLGFIDDFMKFLSEEYSRTPMLYTDGSNHMIQDLTAGLGSKPLFSLNEEVLLKKMAALKYIQRAMIIPSGREPSNNEISQVYQAVTAGCKK